MGSRRVQEAASVRPDRSPGYAYYGKLGVPPGLPPVSGRVQIEVLGGRGHPHYDEPLLIATSPRGAGRLSAVMTSVLNGTSVSEAVSLGTGRYDHTTAYLARAEFPGQRAGVRVVLGYDLDGTPSGVITQVTMTSGLCREFLLELERSVPPDR